MRRHTTSLKRQRGAATLLVTFLLMLLVTVTSMTTSHIGVMEGKKVAAEVRAREARQAAQAGLVHGLAWLKDNACKSGCSALVAPRVSTTTGYNYDPAVTFANVDGYLLVTSTAIANEETSIQATAQQVVSQIDLLSRKGKQAPPILVDGCMSGVIGNPSIYPRPGAAAVESLDPGDCVELGHFDIEMCSSGGDAEACDPADTSSATPVAEADRADHIQHTDRSAEPEPRAWNYMFDISRDEAVAQARAAGQVYSNDNHVPRGPAGDVPFYLYTGHTTFNGHGTRVYGSPASPVVLMIEHESCPQLNGGVTVYGYTYYFADSGSCNGWGGAKTVGTVILEGDANNFNANTEFFDPIHVGAGGNEVVFFDGSTQLSGTWKDW